MLIKKKYSIFALPVLFLLGLLALTPFKTPSSSPSQNTLTVGMHSGYPPFEFMDVNGLLAGFDVDLAKSLAEKLGKALVIKDMEFDGIILALKHGKIDVIMSGMNITPSRLNEIAMVPYHGEATSALSLIFWKTIPEGIHSLEEMAKLPFASVSVESGTMSEIYLKRHKNIPIKSFDAALTALMDVKYGKSLANLVEPDVATYLQQQHPEIKIMPVPLSEKDLILGFGIGIKKENQELYQQIQHAIEQLTASGEMKKLENHWFENQRFKKQQFKGEK